jgi:hypothetical protein
MATANSANFARVAKCRRMQNVEAQEHSIKRNCGNIRAWTESIPSNETVETFCAAGAAVHARESARGKPTTGPLGRARQTEVSCYSLRSRKNIDNLVLA